MTNMLSLLILVRVENRTAHLANEGAVLIVKPHRYMGVVLVYSDVISVKQLFYDVQSYSLTNRKFQAYSRNLINYFATWLEKRSPHEESFVDFRIYSFGPPMFL